MTKTSDIILSRIMLKDFRTLLKDLKFSDSCGVVIGYTRKRSFKLLKMKNDENGRFLILEAIIVDCVVILINLYNRNTKKEHVST